jgi:hypothetical protein
MAKPQLADGLHKLRQASGHQPPAPPPTSIALAPASETRTRANPREGLKQIAGHFEKPVSQQLKLLGVQQDRTEQDLLAEALNDLFVKYGQAELATVYGPGSRSKPRAR